ncbi:site-specific integrase [Alteromonas sp. Cnat3-28]|uniref:site-specific integrase n=1 Tax=Alteromonas sp. Cnat3-28 TaxID=2917729 RepID=UPI001EF52213|nr:site-specific integrase [Alteromonas sp. Cnat3-28]MCG7644333.1 site-specific integrase [Alteromonas sp. Cnat3-28]
MLLKKNAEKLKTVRGVSIRYDKHERATGIQLAFTYKGILCREPVGYAITQAGLNAAANKLGTIKHEIAKETFFYADFFPKSKKLALFGGATKGITVKTYLDRYIDKAKVRKLSIATIVGYKKDLNGLKALWNIPVAELERINIVNYVSNATVSSKTLGNRLSVLRSALDEAITDKVIKLNPLVGFKLKDHIDIETKHDNRQKHLDVLPFTPNEMTKIINETCETEKAIVTLLSETGLRSSEWIALKKTDVCLISLEVSIYDAVVHGTTKSTKTKAGKRTIPISQELADMLELEMDKHDEEYVFVNDQGRRWNADSFRKHRWSKIIERAGVRYRYPYQLRHTFATRLISQGENLWKISKLMGHASPQQLFEHYGNYIEAYEKQSKRQEARSR